MSRARIVLVLTAATSLGWSLLAQDVPTFSSDVKVVNVLATVRDKHGQIVNNLTKDDFKLQQDGQPQSIHYFAKETDLPLTLGLLVDTSMSQRRLIDQERTASYSFLNNLMRPDKDKAFVIHFDWEVELLQDTTDSRPKLEAALDKLDNPQFAPANGGGGGGNGGGGSSGGGYPSGGSGRGGGHHMGGGTDLYDAVFLASDEVAKKLKGRKALIILSDGVDTGSKVSLDRAIETAQRSDTLVYSILYADPEAYGHQGYPAEAWGVTVVGAGLVGWAVVAAILSNSPTRMARRSWSVSPAKPAAVSLKCRRSSPSTESIRRSSRNCAINTAWAIRRTKLLPAPATTRSP